MKKIMKKITNNAPLKIVSIFLGYGIWFTLSQYHTLNITTQIPVCFYGAQSGAICDAPETISLTLSGTRHAFTAIELSSLAAHIDADQLNPGSNALEITKSMLFLPEQVNLVHCKPAYLQVTINSAADAHQSPA